MFPNDNTPLSDARQPIDLINIVEEKAIIKKTIKVKMIVYLNYKIGGICAKLVLRETKINTLQILNWNLKIVALNNIRATTFLHISQVFIDFFCYCLHDCLIERRILE